MGSPMPYTPITSAQIKDALQGTKIRSARGGDGFSTMDLRKLPCELHEWLANIFHVCEQGSAWPGRWMLAKTHCLPKGFQPKSPLDIRPVTVLGKTYRPWSWQPPSTGSGRDCKGHQRRPHGHVYGRKG